MGRIPAAATPSAGRLPPPGGVAGGEAVATGRSQLLPPDDRRVLPLGPVRRAAAPEGFEPAKGFEPAEGLDPPDGFDPVLDLEPAVRRTGPPPLRMRGSLTDERSRKMRRIGVPSKPNSARSWFSM